MEHRKVFHDSVAELPAQPAMTPLGLKVNERDPKQDSEPLQLTFTLTDYDKEKALEALVAAGKVLPVSALETKYAVPQSRVDALTTWLKSQGFDIMSVSKDRSCVFARATVAQIEHSLQVKMVRVTRNGVTHTAAQSAPSLPADIGAEVDSIGGLQPFLHMHKHFRKITPFVSRPPGRDGAAQQMEAAALGNVKPPPYKPWDILKAYGADNLTVTGKGQIIAILIDTFPDDADLQAFWTQCGLPDDLSRITKINVGGGTLPPTEGEETLDTQWASSIAPGASVRIYASGSLQFTDLNRALDRILNDLTDAPTLRQLSISLGAGETLLPKGTIRTQHQRLVRLAAAGVNIFVSSGDAGSNPDSNGTSGGPLQAEFAASDPCVVGVGGTTLVLAQDGSVQSETGWADGGGGTSAMFKRAEWQAGDGVRAGTNRLVPDVSLTADPNEGALVVLNGEPQPVGGTSWSAPVWAGFCALINEARTKAGKEPLPFINPIIYPLLGTANFRDISKGSNGAYTAGPGFDMVTGIGVPDIKNLLQALTT